MAPNIILVTSKQKNKLVLPMIELPLAKVTKKCSTYWIIQTCPNKKEKKRLVIRMLQNQPPPLPLSLKHEKNHLPSNSRKQSRHWKLCSKMYTTMSVPNVGMVVICCVVIIAIWSTMKDVCLLMHDPTKMNRSNGHVQHAPKNKKNKRTLEDVHMHVITNT